MVPLDVPGVLIDASNICRDDKLAPRDSPAAWSRLEHLLRNLKASSAITFEDAYIVADSSLTHRLEKDGRQSLRRLEEQGRAEVRKFADERLVELAFRPDSQLQGFAIATHDFFDDFRRRYPEIEKSPAIRWEPDGSGIPIPLIGTFGSRTHQRVSRKEEESELRERRLRRHEVQDRAAARHFRCANSSCLVARLWPDGLQELPRYDESSDSFVCPSCRGSLDPGAPRGPAVQLIVFMDGVEQSRILVEEGHDVAIGRADSRGVVGLERHIAPEHVKAVSRRQVLVRLVGRRLTVTDLGSKNGTSIGRRNAQVAERTKCREGQAVEWAVRDAVFLPEGITLERSGRKLPIGGDRAPNTHPAEPSASATALATESPQLE